MYNKIYLYFALLCLIAGTSCVTSSKCQRKFPSQRDTLKIVSVKDSIVIKDTTIFIHLPGELIKDSIIIPCPEPGPAYIPKKVCAETSLARACAWWSYPVIKLELIQRDTTIEKKLDAAIKEAWHWKAEFEKITVTPAPVKYVPGFYKVCTFCFVGFMLAFAGFVILKILKYI